MSYAFQTRFHSFNNVRTRYFLAVESHWGRWWSEHYWAESRKQINLLSTLRVCSWAWTGWFSNGYSARLTASRSSGTQEPLEQQFLIKQQDYFMSGQNFCSTVIRRFTATLQSKSFITENTIMSLCTIIYTVSCILNTQLIPHLKKDTAGQEKVHGSYKAMGRLLLEGWLRHFNLEKRQPKRLDRCLWNHDRHGEGGQGLPLVNWQLVSSSTRSPGHKMRLT